MEIAMKVPEYLKNLRVALRGPQEFFDVQPADLNQATSRISYNTRYFSGNYGFIVIILAVYLAIDQSGFLDWRYAPISRRSRSGKRAPEPMQVGDPLGTFFWLVGSSAVLILGHAALMEPGVESEYANVSEV
ncbi:PRA1 domain-containing protein [Rhizoctonia solani AG-1 IA]|uniref:PRA1 family protein n=1 Tax=Thanatephorus cucumeris (strain AG1-IA) TaxID=983506 RepID=L8WJV0_THACA|nr:PRA1 domain-containing protein [Rhizoctonia solani AG-1 IA]